MAGTDAALPSLELVARSCLCRRVQHASRAIGKRFDDAFRPVGLNNWQFTLLMAVTAEAGPTVNQIAAELGMDRTTATKNLRILERRGLIEMRVDAQDRRIRRSALTAEGQQVLQAALLRWRQVNDAVGGSLRPEQLASLNAALETIAQA
ncbi:hypothetical protein BKE38_20710 [Pseudoroseomonas deserti]|uniref:HTH marR-type domain-containing protein n=1 Tax=Teichococcus deserti TaxID=1817963 RepID=A0A1V2GY51_9PROT|nr:MarR family winged helix-turn-helix transcriptional regulator [Pseudoroseomonas deserti]ONG49502.1 hypothetical protein BKE38_20710 [Pseudoroseomonas deserti]